MRTGAAWDFGVVDKGRDILSATYTPTWNNKFNFLQRIVRYKDGESDAGTDLGGTLAAPTGGASGLGFLMEWNASDGVFDAVLANTTSAANKGGVLWGVTPKKENGVPIDKIEEGDLFTLITSAERIEYSDVGANAAAGANVYLTTDTEIDDAVIANMMIANAWFAETRAATDGPADITLRNSHVE